MCQNASDILVVLFLMKVNGMLETANNEITKCPFDVTGNVYNHTKKSLIEVKIVKIK